MSEKRQMHNDKHLTSSNGLETNLNFIFSMISMAIGAVNICKNMLFSINIFMSEIIRVPLTMSSVQLSYSKLWCTL